MLIDALIVPVAIDLYSSGQQQGLSRILFDEKGR